MLAALQEQYRRRDRPLPRRAERLALLPQGAVPWISPETDPAWMLEAAGRVLVVIPRGADVAEIVARHLLPFILSRSTPGQAVLMRTLRTAGVGHLRGHDLRHSASSILQALGLPPLATMEVLGHASPDVTMGIYGHLLSASRRQATRFIPPFPPRIHPTFLRLGCRLISPAPRSPPLT